MNYQHKTARNQTPKGSVVWRILQFTLFAVACVWLLYQMRCSLYMSRAKDCDYGGRKLRGGRIGKMLGRKGNVGTSHNSHEIKLYASNNVKGKGEEETMDDSTLQWRSLEEVSNEDEEISMEKKKTDSLMGELHNETLISDKLKDEDEEFGNRDEEFGNKEEIEVKPNMNFGAVILKTDENGVLKQDSSPSRRSDIESSPTQNTSNFGNQSREIKACEKIILQDILENKSLKKFQPEKVNRRELLLWQNISEY